MSNIDTDLRTVLQAHSSELQTRFHVHSLSVFGSAGKGTATAKSDIDILVSFSKTPGIFEFLKLKQYLEVLLGKPVDLVTEGALKKQLREEILREAVRVSWGLEIPP